MNPPLTPEELRVLGAMIEKDMATPEYYPLSLNALMNACNQKNNRDPLTSYDEAIVSQTLEGLRARHLATILSGGDHRVPKHGHRAWETLDVNNRELAVLCVMMLRGAQTVNELKTRTERLHAFDDLESVEGCLAKLAGRQMAIQIPKQSGMREPRWMHLLGGAVDIHAPVAEPAPRSDSLADRVSRLEAEVESLRAQMEDLRRELGA
ncbi:MAG: YceH family protein [Acidobacteriia bacterium]|nr:YceH family protein [Terriglobia bacterium]